MSKELAAAVNELLETIWDEAETSYCEGPERVFNETVWKRNDPTLYGHWKKIKKLMKRDGL